MAAAAGTDVRNRSSDGRLDTFAVNTPRAGMRTRLAKTCKTGSDAAIICGGV